MKTTYPDKLTTKTAFSMLAISLGLALEVCQPAMAATQLLAMSDHASVEKSQPVQSPRAIYRGRVKPEPPPLPFYRQVISESPGYHRYSAHPRNERRTGGQRPQLAAKLYYQAPSTTIINRQVEVIAPQNATSDVYFNQDTYYLYPSGSGSYHPAQRYIPPVIPVSRDPQATENRAKQWTDKADFNP